MLLSRLSEAGKKGQWSRVKQTFGKYAGCSAPVYNAAIAIKYPAAFLALAASVSGLHCQCKPMQGRRQEMLMACVAFLT